MARDRSIDVRLGLSYADYITGLGKASAATKAFAEQVDKLDRKDPTVDVDVNAKRALAELKAAATAGDDLDSHLIDIGRNSGGAARGLNEVGQAGGSFVRRSARGPAILGGIAAAAALIGPVTAAAAAGVAELGSAAAIAALAYHGFKQEIEDGTELGKQVQSEIDKITAAIDHLGRVAAGGVGPGVVSAFQKINAYLSSMDGPVRRLASHLGNAFSIGTGGLISALETMAPLLEDAGVDAEQLARKFAEFARSQDFRDFIAYAREELPQVLDMLESLTKGAVGLAKALAPVGEGLVTALDGFGKFLQVAPDVIARMGRMGDLSHGPKAFAENLIHLGAASDDVKVHMAPMDDQLQSYKSHLNAADNAARQLAANQRNAGPSMDAFGNKLVDIDGKAVDAKTALDNLANSVQGLGSTALDVSETQIALEQAIDDVTRSVKDNGKTLNVHTEAGRRNKTVFDNVVRTSRAHIAAMIRDGRSTRDVTQATKSANREIDQAAHKLSGNAQAADRLSRKYRISKGDIDNLRTSLDRVPGNTEAHVSTPGAKQARDEVDGLHGSIFRLKGKTVRVGETGATAAAGTVRYLQSEIDRLHGKTVTVNVHTIKTFGGGTLRYLNQADGGVLDFQRYANGGVAEQHVAQIAKPGTMRLWAEPETGGEAYIPLSPAKRARSEAILDEVAGRFGMKLSRYADGAVTTPRFSSMGPVSRHAGPGAGQFPSELHLSGPVVLTVDGRQMGGYIDGRADARIGNHQRRVQGAVS